MVYIVSWDDFLQKSLHLFRSNPHKTRYVIKYRNCDGKLVMKVTDDKEFAATRFVLTVEFHEPYVVDDNFGGLITSISTCIKFKTDQAQDAKKMEKLNNMFFTLMANGPEADISEAGGKEQMDVQSSKKGRGRKQ